MATEHDESWSEADEALLADLFAAGRTAPEVSSALTARILADAGAELARAGLAAASAVPAALPAATAPAAAAPGFFAGLVAALGGWPAMSGMAAATAAGVWLGFASPALIEGTGYLGSDYTLGDLMPSAVLAAAETGGE